MIEFDVETAPHNEGWAGAAVQWYASTPFIVQFGIYAGGGEWEVEPIYFSHPDDKDQIQIWLDRTDHDFRAWNSKFDLHQLAAAGYRLPDESRWHDGMVMAKLAANLRYGAALKKVAGDLFSDDTRDPEKALKGWLEQERKGRKKAAKEGNSEYVAPNYGDVPMEIMVPYALEDIVLTARVSEHYQRVLKANEDIAEVYEFERKVMAALYHVERRGMPIDRKAAVAFEAELQDNLDPLLEKAIELSGDPEFNPGSGKQIADALERRGVDLSKLDKTPTGKPKTDAENLRRVDDELTRAILQFKAESKVFSTYVRPLLHPKYESRLGGEVAPLLTPENRLHSNFNQLGAITGRMSSNMPNVQNWPRDDLRMRYLMRAEPGMKLVTADLDSIELVLFAAYAGDGMLLNLVRNGEDMHTYTAEAVGLKDFQRANGVESKRQRGKTFNYSVLYGAGVNSIKSHFEVSQDEARRMLKMYHKAYPEVQNLQAVIEHKLYERGYIKTYFGQRMYVDPNEAYKGVNYLVQGTAAGMLKAALIRLHDEGAPVIALVHDEIVLHVPEDEAEAWSKKLVHAMIDFPELQDKVPIGAEAQIVDRWSDAKTPGWAPDYAARI